MVVNLEERSVEVSSLIISVGMDLREGETLVGEDGISMDNHRYNVRPIKGISSEVDCSVEGSLCEVEGQKSKGVSRGRKYHLYTAQEKAHCEVLVGNHLSWDGVLRSCNMGGFPIIILSLICRGLGSPSKKQALKRLVEVHRPNILFLHETMG